MPNRIRKVKNPKRVSAGKKAWEKTQFLNSISETGSIDWVKLEQANRRPTSIADFDIGDLELPNNVFHI